MEKDIRENNKSVIDNISLLPKLSVLIIVISIVYNIFYYNYFGLQIKYFMAFSELGIAISDDLVYLIPGYMLLVLTTMFSDKLNKFVTKVNRKKQGDDEKEIKILEEKNAVFARFIVSALILTIFILEINFRHSKLIIFKSALTMLVGFCIITIITAKENYLPNNLLAKWNFTLVALFIISATFRLSFILDRVTGGKYNGTIITTSDTTYISNDSTYFIGKTEKYIFIYKAKENGTLVIPSETVKQMFIKSK